MTSVSKHLDAAILAYQQHGTDLRGGAALAGISYNEFVQEVQARNIVVLENDRFLDELAFLASAFANETLQRAVQKVRYSTTETPMTKLSV